MITLAPEDTLAGWMVMMRIYVKQFKNLPREENREESVKEFRREVELGMKEIEGKMTSLAIESDSRKRHFHLTNWASRMQVFLLNLGILDRNLALTKGQRWNWNEVICAMAFLQAIYKGACVTLWQNCAE